MRRAADAGLPTARYLLGMMTERGAGVKQDPEAAAQLYRQAAEKGNRNGQARWGLALLEGRGVERNASEGESWLRRAALAGDPEAAALVGDLYAKGGTLPPNYAEAAIWFRRAAEAGHRGGDPHDGSPAPDRRRHRARPHRGGALVPPLRRDGRPASQTELGNLVLQGLAEPDDQLKTREWFEQAAEAGDLIAAFNYGICLAEGVGVERDERRAAQWLRRAADGVVNAQYWYGRMLAEGRGVDADPAEGRVWIARAAETGMVDARGHAGGNDGERARRPVRSCRQHSRCSRRPPRRAMPAPCSRSARSMAAATTCRWTCGRAALVPRGGGARPRPRTDDARTLSRARPRRGSAIRRGRGCGWSAPRARAWPKPGPTLPRCRPRPIRLSRPRPGRLPAIDPASASGADRAREPPGRP